MSELPGRPLTELTGLLRSGDLAAVELAAACLDAIAAREDELHAWVSIDREAVLAQARALDQAAPADRGPLHGVPVGVKDIIDTASFPTGYGSPIYAGHRPVADAHVVVRLRAAGALVIGKTVTTEFALFTPGPTVNPHDHTRTPGGSSSGSAAAVAAGTVPLAIGTQTAGSIVRPASYCGVVGVKPTFGAIPTTGVKPCSPTLDTVGVFTSDVGGAVHVMAALGVAVPTTENVRIGFARTTEWELIPDDTKTRIGRALNRIAAEREVTAVDLPFAGLVEAQAAVQLVEATQSLAGDRALWSYQAARSHIDRCRRRLGDVFDQVDVLLTPSVLGEAPPLDDGTGDPVLCRAWTALGTPAVSVPGLAGPAGLPVGVQVVAAPGRDDLALVGARIISRILQPDR